MEQSDLEFLELYIRSFAIISSGKMISITRVDTKEFIYVSQPMIRLFRNDDSLIGKRLDNIPVLEPFIDEYMLLFKKVLQKSGPVNALIAHDFSNTGIKTIKVLHKQPIISPLTGTILAIIDEIKDFAMNRELSQFISLMNYHADTINENPQIQSEPNITLTKRQQEIIFLLTLGKSPKNIAEFISQLEGKVLAPATITAIINKQLYTKFEVNSTSKLIEKAIIMGFVNNVPDNFIKKSGVLMLLN